MSFITKLNLQDNRQATLPIGETFKSSGITEFGVTFIDLPSGPDPTDSGTTSVTTGVTSTFSGNTGTTVFTFGDSNMNLAQGFVTITDANSGSTFFTGNYFTGNTSQVLDGNTSYLDYTGVSFSFTVTGITETSPDVFTGSGVSTVTYLSAGTLDYTGSTVWNDVKGISKSERNYVRYFQAIGHEDPTEQLDVLFNGRFRTIGSTASAGALHYDANGVLTTNTSDERMKTNIQTIPNALDKIKALRGVYYQWKSDIEAGNTGNTRIGMIAQEVWGATPELAFINKNTEEKYMGVHYSDAIGLLVEGFKELLTGNTTVLHTQTIAAEDNNIELNFNGDHASANSGGITIIDGVAEGENSTLIIDENGRWVVSPSLIPQELVIPEYTPTGSTDNFGSAGVVVRDENYLYIKRNNGTWGRISMENF